MVVGVPNVGKSSLIKAARSHYISKDSGVSVGSEPGHTRRVSHKIKVFYQHKNVHTHTLVCQCLAVTLPFVCGNNSSGSCGHIYCANSTSNQR